MSERRGKGYSLLIADDEEGLRYGLERLFKKKGFKVYALGEFDRAITTAEKYSIDVALLDVRLKSGENGIKLLKELKKIEPDLVAIMITGYGSIDTAVASMKEGASDYILKPIDNTKLVDLVYKSLDLRNLKNENVFLRNELLSQCFSYKFITADPEVRSLIGKADKIKNNVVTILVTGESGTGKEVMARYIHFTSNRSEGKFVSVNCAALSESLLLSELFGHERGAFTGAIERKIGKFEIANKGTLFLDEIGDMSLDIQAKLLRVIEENSFERVGGTKSIMVDVRIIAATNKDLEKWVKEGKFREDLYYRINIVRFHLPPLRQRKEDIPLLIDHFIEKYKYKYNKKALKFNEEAMKALIAYDWPGNVRELENVINNAVLLSERGILGVEGLKRNIFSGTSDNQLAVDISKVTSLKETIDEVVNNYEKQIIHQFLVRNNYNKSKTARELSITRKTLAQKIGKYNLHH
jgi:two-component system response regulator AtoC